jgi:enoyl-CoA hydratase/carnithine racemase
VINEELRERNARIGGFVDRLSLEAYGPRYSDHLVIERDAGVVEVRMHTDQGAAVFSRGLLNTWGQALADIGSDPDNEVLIITGTGDRWIAGIDPRSFAEPLSSWSATELYEQYRDGVKLLERLVFDVEIPTIAAINGPGPRLELGLMCDLTLCSENTLIADGNFHAGSVPGDGLHLVLQELLGVKRAAHMVYTGATVDAATALDLGLVSEVLPAQSLLPRAHELAGMIMSKPRTARRLTHSIVHRPWQRRVAADLRAAYAQQLLASSR